MNDGIRPLSGSERSRLLALLHVEPAAPSSSALERLQWAFLRFSPFHNLALLAASEGVPPPLDAAVAITEVLEGRGGPCHVQACAFLALLRSLGYEARLAAGTIAHDGDHLVVVVRLSDGELVSDVGNGHPYAKPFPLGHAAEQQRFGWRFRTTPTPTGLLLERLFPDSDWRRVYAVDSAPRDFDSFSSIIRAHHERPGFGPFLAGLRAVRLSSDVMLTVRDGRYERHSAAGTTTRPIPDARACRRLLAETFGLAGLPLDAALRGYERVSQDPWGRRHSAIRAGGPAEPSHSVLVTVSATGRPGGLERLGRSLLHEIAGLSEEKSCCLIVIENSVAADARAENRRVLAGLERDGLRVRYVDDGEYGRPIAASRARQTQAIASVPAKTSPLIWMVDDDLSLESLVVRRGCIEVDAGRGYLNRLSDLRRAEPHIAVLLGGVTGDPPIRPDAIFRTQLFDLFANLEWFASLDPRATYRADVQDAAFRMPDYYYDHSRAGDEHLQVPFRWLSRGKPGTVRDELLAYLGAARGIAVGKAPTRPLIHREALEGDLRAGTHRGGNTVFFDFDACLRHTYPSLKVGGTNTRRSDMIGATLLALAGETRVYELPLPLHHERLQGDMTSGFETDRPSREATRISVVGEFFGVLLARLVMDGIPAGVSVEHHARRLAEERAGQILENLAVARRLLSEIADRCATVPAWWRDDAEIVSALDGVIRAVSGALLAHFVERDGPPSGRAQSGLDHWRAELLAPDRIRAVVDEYERLLAASDSPRAASIRAAR